MFLQVANFIILPIGVQICCLHQSAVNDLKNMETWFGGCTQALQLTEATQISYRCDWLRYSKIIDRVDKVNKGTP